jgi:hypothetical protein
MDLDGYWGTIEFGVMDSDKPSERGAGLVIQANRHEFFLTGFNFRLLLRPKPTLRNMQFTLHGGDRSHPGFTNFVLSVDEGHFDQNGEFVPHRRINGDYLRGGVWVGPDDSVMRIITCD